MTTSSPTGFRIEHDGPVATVVIDHGRVNIVGGDFSGVPTQKLRIVSCAGTECVTAIATVQNIVVVATGDDVVTVAAPYGVLIRQTAL